MQVIIAGTGKLATELRHAWRADESHSVQPWHHQSSNSAKSIVVHAGSGRELEAIAAYCEATHSPLIELATGSNIESRPHGFPVILCPNTNILMLKFMSMLEQSGHLFQGHNIKLIESHQAAKTSVPGTAVNMAASLGINRHDIHSVRNPSLQRSELQIPEVDLERHAYHQVLIEDGQCSLKLETRVHGEAPYAQGVARIVDAVRSHELDNRLYSIMEFIHKGWL
jgi:4-hydroxy-tetrahydrodipicolinate reductase